MYRNKKRRLIEMPSLTYPPRGLFHSHVEEGAGHDVPGQRNGFTVIEILILAVILTIVALTAVPMMSSASSVQIRAAASMIAADLEYAKSMAISRGQHYSVEFDASTDSYSIKQEGSDDPIKHPVKKGFDYVVNFQSDTRLNRVHITGANFGEDSYVEFDSMGSPYNSGGTVLLQAGGTTAEITVTSITGYISIN